MRVRQSLLKEFSSCPLRGKFRYVDRIPAKQSAAASAGVVIHYCLDNMVHGMPVEAAIALFKELWNEPERLKVAPDYYPKTMSYHSLRERGIDCLNAFARNRRWENREVIGTEINFLVPFGEHELEGTIDLLEIRKDGRGKKVLSISDFKTGSKQPTRVALALDIQFSSYIWGTLQPEFWAGIPNGDMLKIRTDGMERRGTWIQLMNEAKELDAGTRDDDDFMRLYRLVTEIEKAVKYDVFVPTISADTCTYCEYAGGPCPVKIPAPAA